MNALSVSSALASNTLPLQTSNATELGAIALTFLFMTGLIAGAVVLILRAYRVRTDDEELRARVAALERDVEALNERLEGEQ